MAENEVREKLPEIHNLISKNAANYDWTIILAMLESLNFLNFTDTNPANLVISIFHLMDNWADSELTLSKKYNLLKLMKIKLTITSFLSKISEKLQIKEITSTFQSGLSFPKFTESSKTLLKTCSPDFFPATALKVYEIFSEIRKQANGLFMCFEKHLKQEKSPNISEMIDKVFYENVVAEYKAQFQSDSSTRPILQDFDKYTKSRVSRDDTISVPSSNFMNKMRNQYMGELNEKNLREGYGKISYSTGDSYEGFWKDNKKHGKGLYKYRNGGSYLGDFLEDLPSGIGQRVYSSGNHFEGNFAKGKKNGKGVMVFRNGDRYEGSWENDDMHGEGSYFWRTGDYFVGAFERDQREGAGILYLVNGEIIEGIWKNNSLLTS